MKTSPATILHFMLLACLPAASYLPAGAAHLKGGYMEYEYLGPTPGQSGQSRYRIKVYQYIDCGSIGGQVDEQIFIGFFNGTAGELNFSKAVGLNNSEFLRRQRYPCLNNPPIVCYRVDSYVTEVDLPNRLDGYTVAVQRCCRIANIVNVQNSFSTGITYSIHIPMPLVGNSILRNSSPVFAQSDTTLVCAGNSFEWLFEATDPDGDSLSYQFTTGRNSPSAEAKPNPPLPPPFPPVAYNGGFQASAPMGGDIRINERTGVISGIAPPISGDYVVAVLVNEYRNGQKIGETRKELHITVGTCDIARAELPPSIINCDSLGVRFQNQAVSSGIFAYHWDFGVNNSSSDTSNLPTPLFQFPDTGVYRVKLVVNRGGDCPDSTFTEVRVFPGFSADFSVEGVCLQLPYQFTDRTVARYGVVDSWRWDFGVADRTDDTSRLRNPSFLYRTAGPSTVTLIAGSNKGCIDTVQRNVNIAAEPVLELAFKDTLICSIDSLQLRGLSPGAYSWTPAANMVGSNTPSPIVFPKETTTYRATMSNGGCVASDTVRVRVLDFITVELGADTSICLTDAVTLRPNTEALSFSWEPAALFEDASVKNATLRPTSTSTLVRLRANLGKCQAEDSLTIRAVPYPLVAAGADTAICFGTTATLRGSGNGSSVRWSPAGSVRQPGSYTTVATPRSTTTYVLTVTDTLGCPKPVTDTVLVTVYPRIQVFAGNDTSAVRGQPLLLQGTADVADLRWSPATFLTGANTATPTFTVPAQATLGSLGDYYILTLTATSPEGCTATDDLRIRLFEQPAIYVPTAFTPNADGLNDALRPILAGMQQLEYFRIFNRYGQLVFDTRTEGRGWDGRVNGIPQPAGTYVYQCSAIDYRGNRQMVKGNFVLIR